MLTLDYTTYFDNSELVTTLNTFVNTFPALATLQSIGKSFAGNDIWLVTLTNTETGPPRSKPALWLDGNIHATEVTGCMAALHVIDTLLNGYGSVEECTRLLDTTTLYVVPRVNPDGADRALHTPYQLRSSIRPYPFPERKDGLYPEDIDQNGVIVTMRIQDPNGDWRVSEQDARVMVKRRPDEFGGTYYRILPEGMIQNYDGVNIKLSPSLEGLDINRNFPGSWRPENEQFGAGPFPTSEPEIRAIVEFLTSHPEIHSAITYHTFSGVLLRPHSAQSDEAFDLHDLAVYKAIGQRGTELTGYPNVAVFHDFRYHPKEVISGVFDDWAYDHLGMFAWTVEHWDMVGEAGIKERKFIEWFKDHPEEDDLKLMRWNDDHAAGQAFLDWTPFDHPQLGPVEIGGWHPMYAFRNPPHAFLPETCEKSTRFVLFHASIAPLLSVQTFEAEHLGDHLYRLQAVIQNNGFLPTYGSRQAKQRKACFPLSVRLDLPDGAQIKQGEQRQDLDHLEGRSARLEHMSSGATNDRTKVEWVVYVPQAGSITVTVEGGRGGTATAALTPQPAATTNDDLWQ